jgi:hypothetical protein
VPIPLICRVPPAWRALRGSWMVLSFVYLVFVALLKLLLRSGRRVDVKD